MTAFAGRLFKLKIEYPVGSGAYIDFGGLTNCSITITNEEVDITDKFSNGVKELLENAGVQSISVSGELYTKDVIPDALIQDVTVNNEFCAIRVTSGVGDKYTASVQVTNLERTGSFNDMEKYSLSFSTSGDVLMAVKYWYAQFDLLSLGTDIVGLTEDSVEVLSGTDISYPVQQNGLNVKVWHDTVNGIIYSQSGESYTYNDTLVTQNAANYWYKFNGNISADSGGISLTNTGSVVINATNAQFTKVSNQKLSSSTGVSNSTWTSVSCFMEMNTDVIAGNRYIVTIGDGSQSSFMFGIAQMTGGNTIKPFVWAISNPAGSGSGTISPIFGGVDHTIVNGEIFHVAVTCNKDTSQVKFYINGMLANNFFTYNYSAGMYILKTAGTSLISIGKMGIGISTSFLGKVYDLKVFNSEITDNLAQTLYSEGFESVVLPIATEYTGVFGQLKPAAYNPANVTTDTTSTITTHPDANDWQPYGS